MRIHAVSATTAVATATGTRVGILGAVAWGESRPAWTSLRLRETRGSDDSVRVDDSVDDNLPGAEEG